MPCSKRLIPTPSLTTASMRLQFRVARPQLDFQVELFPASLAVTRESWLVSFLRLVICLNSAGPLASIWRSKKEVSSQSLAINLEKKRNTLRELFAVRFIRPTIVSRCQAYLPTTACFGMCRIKPHNLPTLGWLEKGHREKQVFK